MEGWVFDVQEERKGVGLWLVDEWGKTHKLACPFRPYFYITGNKSSIRAALKFLDQWKVPIFLEREEKKEFYSNKIIPCLKVSIDSPLAYPKIVQALIPQRERGFELYTCDIPVAQLFFIEKGLFPIAKVKVEIEKDPSFSLDDSPWETDYSLPPLETMEIEMKNLAKSRAREILMVTCCVLAATTSFADDTAERIAPSDLTAIEQVGPGAFLALLEEVRLLRMEVLELRRERSDERIAGLERELNQVADERVEVEEQYDIADMELTEAEGQLSDPDLGDADRAYLEATIRKRDSRQSHSLAASEDRLEAREDELFARLQNIRRERERMSAALAALRQPRS